MNCYLHPDALAIAFCRSCGRPLCVVCQRIVLGTVYCQDHAPAPSYAANPDPAPSAAPNPYFQAAPPPGAAPHVHNWPGLAFVLGWIPGVGAIYNGQYLKGLVHAIIFGLIISLLDSTSGSGQPFLAMIMMAFVFYMAFEAYHTAKKRQLGLPIEEWSSLLGKTTSGMGTRAPVGPIFLIVIGVLFLLDTLHLIEFREIGRFWPVLLIAVGAYMLWTRVTTTPPAAATQRPYPEARETVSYPPPDTTTNPVMETRHE